MALRKCKDCGNQISTKATACPKCGAVVKKRSGCLSLIAIVVLMIVVISIISSKIGQDQQKWEDENKKAPQGTAERAVLEIRRTLGTSNRTVQRVRALAINGGRVELDIAFNMNLTTGMTLFGVKRDVCDVLQALRRSEFAFDSVTITGTLPLVDKYGRESEDEVVKAVYLAHTANRINWDNFLCENVFDVADTVWLHPAFPK